MRKMTNRERYLFVGIGIGVGLVLAVLGLRLLGPRFSGHQDYDLRKTVGPVTAPVHVLEFSDYQCPACKAAEPVVEEILQAYSGRVHFVFHHFPLASHKWATLASQASECAAGQNKFWDYHKLLFSNQAIWSKEDRPVDTMVKYAESLGLDLDGFAKCLSDRKVSEVIFDDKKEGVGRKVSSTPTFFINGQRFVGAAQLKKEGIPFIRKELGLGVEVDSPA